MSWDAVRGQARAIEYLRQSAAAGRLAHALLFAGPPGVGKNLTARLLATALLCKRSTDGRLEACGECRGCRLMAAGNHPDFLSVACPEGKSELPIELLVGSLDNRGREGLCHDLSLRPMLGRRRVAVIDDADRMSTESANAILKTLEEPPPYALIILIAADLGRILPTIRSRCQTIRFNPLPVDDVADLVRTLGWTESPDEARAAAEISGGSLTVAQQVLDPQLQAVRKALFLELEKSRLEPFTIGKTLLEALDGLGGDTRANAPTPVGSSASPSSFCKRKSAPPAESTPRRWRRRKGSPGPSSGVSMPRNRSTRMPRFRSASRRWRATWHSSWPGPQPKLATPSAAGG